MKKEHAKPLPRLFGIALSAVIILAGICLIAACVSIYRSGDQPYSPESVANAFSYIAVVIYLCLGMVVLGFLGSLFFPIDIKKRPPEKQYPLILSRLQQSKTLDGCAPELRQQILAQRRLRKRVTWITGVLLLLGSTVFLSYALDASHFPLEDINGAVLRSFLLLLPCAAIPFAAAVFSACANKKSMIAEIALLKQAPAAARPTAPPAKKTFPIGIPAARTVLLVLGVAILIYGFVTGGTADVLVKAINICTECVGLG